MSARKAVIEDAKIVNMIVADDEYEDPHGREIIEGAGLAIGMVRHEGEWKRPEEIYSEDPS